MINPFAVADKLWQDIEALEPQYKTQEIVTAMIVKVLMEMHGYGYNNAKEFYVDKPAGWGKSDNVT